MYTEDDTIKRLKRPSKAEMHHMREAAWIEFQSAHSGVIGWWQLWEELSNNLLAANGWPDSEFFKP